MFTTRPTLQGTFGMVSSTHWLASQSAMAVLEDGGNAYDAAVAAGFVLHVVEPHLNGPAGEVPIILAPADGAVRVLCGQGVAPAGATIAHYRGLGLDLVPGTGPLAAAVPGAFDAWMLLLRDHGTRPLADVLKYAIGYAEDGHPPVERVGETVDTVRALFETEWTSSAEVYLPGGRPPRPGELFRNPALAATWRRLLDEVSGAGDRVAEIDAAREVWRSGFIAEALVRQAGRPTMDTSGKRHTGTLTAADLALLVRGLRGPGDVRLARLDPVQGGPLEPGPGPPPATGAAPARTAPLRLRRLRPPARRGLQARHGRPGGLVRRRGRGTARRAAVGALQRRPPGPRRAQGVVRAASRRSGRPRSAVEPATRAWWPPGSPASTRSRYRAPHEPTTARAASEPEVAAHGGTRGDTCHLDVVDRWGNMVAATPSGGWLQSNPVVPELGFPLGTRLQMAWLEEGLPNSLTPGRRPRTTLTPSLALRDGVPVMAFGTPGGDQQDQWQTHFFLSVALRSEVRGGLDLQGAIDAPNWHNDSFPGSFYPRGMRPGSLTVESRTDEAVVEELRRRGHDVTVAESWSEGRLCAVARDPATGVLSAGANPRGMQGYAVGR